MNAIKETMSALLFGLFCALAIIVVFAVIDAARGATCMTKAEARKIWPRSHIYWHTSDHCWDNRKGGGRRYEARAEVKPEAKKEKKIDPPPAKRPMILYPTIRDDTNKIY